MITDTVLPSTERRLREIHRLFGNASRRVIGRQLQTYAGRRDEHIRRARWFAERGHIEQAQHWAQQARAVHRIWRAFTLFRAERWL